MPVLLVLAPVFSLGVLPLAEARVFEPADGFLARLGLAFFVLVSG